MPASCYIISDSQVEHNHDQPCRLSTNTQMRFQAFGVGDSFWILKVPPTMKDAAHKQLSPSTLKYPVSSERCRPPISPRGLDAPLLK